MDGGATTQQQPASLSSANNDTSARAPSDTSPRKSESLLSKSGSNSHLNTSGAQGSNWFPWVRKSTTGSSTKLSSISPESPGPAIDAENIQPNGASNAAQTTSSISTSRSTQNMSAQEGRPSESRQRQDSRKSRFGVAASTSPALPKSSSGKVKGGRKRAATSFSILSSPTSSITESVGTESMPADVSASTPQQALSPPSTSQTIATSPSSAAATSATAITPSSSASTVKPKRFSGITHVGRRISVSAGMDNSQLPLSTSPQSGTSTGTEPVSSAQNLAPAISLQRQLTQNKIPSSPSILGSVQHPRRGSIFMDAVMNGAPMPIVSPSTSPVSSGLPDLATGTVDSTKIPPLVERRKSATTLHGRTSRVNGTTTRNDTTVPSDAIAEGTDSLNSSLNKPSFSGNHQTAASQQTASAPPQSQTSETTDILLLATTVPLADASSSKPEVSREKTIIKGVFSPESTMGRKDRAVVKVTLTSPPISRSVINASSISSDLLSESSNQELQVSDNNANVDTLRTSYLEPPSPTHTSNTHKSLSTSPSDASSLLSEVNMSIGDASSTGRNSTISGIDATSVKPSNPTETSNDISASNGSASNTQYRGPDQRKLSINSNLSDSAALDRGSKKSLESNDSASKDDQVFGLTSPSDGLKSDSLSPKLSRTSAVTISPASSSGPQTPHFPHDVTTPGSTMDRAPTQKTRSSRVSTNREPHYKECRQFVALFPEIKDAYTDFVNSYSCALERDILWHGRIFITQRQVCFYASLFGQTIKLVIDYIDIRRVEKRSTAGMFPNAIKISIMDGKYYVFTSLLKRDATYDLILLQWQKWKHVPSTLQRDLSVLTRDAVLDAADDREALSPSVSAGNSGATQGDESNNGTPLASANTDVSSNTTPVAGAKMTENRRLSLLNIGDKNYAGQFGASPGSETSKSPSPDLQFKIVFPDLRPTGRRLRAATELRPPTTIGEDPSQDGPASPPLSPSEMMAAQHKAASAGELLQPSKKTSRVSNRGKSMRRPPSASHSEGVSHSRISETHGENSMSSLALPGSATNGSPADHPQKKIPGSASKNTPTDGRADESVDDTDDPSRVFSDGYEDETNDTDGGQSDHRRLGNHGKGNMDEHSQRSHNVRHHIHHHHHGHGLAPGQQSPISVSTNQRRLSKQGMLIPTPASAFPSSPDRNSVRRYSRGHRRPSFLWKQMFPTEPVICGCDAASHYTTSISDVQVPLYVDTAFDVLFGTDDAFWTRHMARVLMLDNVSVASWAVAKSGSLMRDVSYTLPKTGSISTLLEPGGTCLDVQRLVRSREFHYYVVDCTVSLAPASKKTKKPTQETEKSVAPAPTSTATESQPSESISPTVSYRVCITHMGPHMCRIVMTCKFPADLQTKLEPGWREFGNQIVGALGKFSKAEAGTPSISPLSVFSAATVSSGNSFAALLGAITRNLDWKWSDDGHGKPQSDAIGTANSKSSPTNTSKSQEESGSVTQSKRSLVSVGQKLLTPKGPMRLVAIVVAGFVSVWFMFSSMRMVFRSRHATIPVERISNTVVPSLPENAVSDASTTSSTLSSASSIASETFHATDTASTKTDTAQSHQATVEDINRLLKIIDAQIGYRLASIRDKSDEAFTRTRALSDTLRKIHDDARAASWIWTQTQGSPFSAWSAAGPEKDPFGQSDSEPASTQNQAQSQPQ